MAESRFHGLMGSLAAGREAVWAINPGGASVDVVDMLARAGVSCLFIDCERTAVNIESVTALTRCAHSHGMAAIVRSESMQAETLVRYLDRGIDGIVVPHTETVAQLDAIGEVVRYVSKGRREQVFAIAQIESHAAVRNVEALAACQSLDGFLIGPNDLSHSMGFAGDLRVPELARAIDRVVQTLQAHGRAWGLPGQADTAAGWAERGARFLYGTLEQIVRAGYGPMAGAAAAAADTASQPPKELVR